MFPETASLFILRPCSLPREEVVQSDPLTSPDLPPGSLFPSSGCLPPRLPHRAGLGPSLQEGAGL